MLSGRLFKHIYFLLLSFFSALGNVVVGQEGLEQESTPNLVNAFLLTPLLSKVEKSVEGGGCRKALSAVPIHQSYFSLAR